MNSFTMNLLLAMCPFFFLSSLGIFCSIGATPKPIIKQQDIDTATGPIMDEFTYVDKTRFIPQLCYRKHNQFFFQRPRRFGKTMFLRTLQAALDRHRNGEDILCGTFLSNQTSGWTWQKYPLLYFDFSKGRLSITLKNELDRFKKIENIIEIPKECQRNSTEDIEKLIPEVELLREVLCTVNENTKKQHMVILVDEYDHFVLENSNCPAALEEAEKILRSFFGVFKSEANRIKLAFVTGVSRFPYITTGSSGGELEDISKYSEYGEIAGVTDEELGVYFLSHIQNVASYRNITLDEVKNELKNWYNGYSFTGDESLYNPYSLTLYFKHKKAGIFWGNTGQTTYFWDQMKRRPQEFENLDDTVTSDLIVKGNVNIEDPHILMYEAGYLTVDRVDKSAECLQYVLHFANMEVRQAFFKNLIIAKDLNQYECITPQILVMKETLEKKIPDFNNFICTLNTVIQRLSFNFNNEEGYHSIIYLLLERCRFQNLRSKHKIKGNRIDITFKTQYTNFLFELKLERQGLKATWNQVEGSIPHVFYEGKNILAAAILISPSVQRGVAICQWKAKLFDDEGKVMLKDFNHINAKWLQLYGPKNKKIKENFASNSSTKKTARKRVLKDSTKSLNYSIKKTQEKANTNGSYKSFAYTM